MDEFTLQPCSDHPAVSLLQAESGLIVHSQTQVSLYNSSVLPVMGLQPIIPWVVSTPLLSVESTLISN